MVKWMIWAAVAVVAALLLDRLFLRLEAGGLIFYRRTRGVRGGTGPPPRGMRITAHGSGGPEDPPRQNNSTAHRPPRRPYASETTTVEKFARKSASVSCSSPSPALLSYGLPSTPHGL